MFYFPLGLLVVLILANFFSQYLSWKAVGICVAIFFASFFFPRPVATVISVLLDVILMIKFKLEHF